MWDVSGALALARPACVCKCDSCLTCSLGVAQAGVRLAGCRLAREGLARGQAGVSSTPGTSPAGVLAAMHRAPARSRFPLTSFIRPPHEASPACQRDLCRVRVLAEDCCSAGTEGPSPVSTGSSSRPDLWSSAGCWEEHRGHVGNSHPPPSPVRQGVGGGNGLCGMEQ